MSELETSVTKIKEFFGTPNEQGFFVSSKKRLFKPKVVSVTLGSLEYRATFGAALPIKTWIAQTLHGRTSVFRVGIITKYAVGVTLFMVLAFFLSQVLVVPGPVASAEVILEQGNTKVVSAGAQEEIVAAFGTAMSEYIPQAIDEATVQARSSLLARYLQERNSPLVEYASVIAAQPHWKLILAISFAESSLGKNCVDNNCSGIGVAPGHEKWQTYETKGDWVMALNRLLEKRYKDKTLNQMCGVYVQPCNANWLLATTQILDELKDRNIK